MTDREKLIELLSENFAECCNVDIVAGHCKIRAITFDVDRFADHLLSNGVTFRKWIPVTERLPDKSGFVLVFTCDEVVGEAMMESDGKFYWTNTDEYELPLFVTHWMPLPEPPKE